jgi:hypothetical protein
MKKQRKYEGVFKPRISEYLRSGSRFRCLMPGRRSAKTFGMANDVLNKIQMFQQNEYEGDLIYVAPTYKQAKKIFWKKLMVVLNYHDPLGALIDKSKGVNGYLYSDPRQIFFKGNLNFVLCGANNPETLEGDGYLAGWLDEAPDMKYETWEEHLQPAFADTEGLVTIGGCPQGIDNWTYDIFRDEEWESFNWSAYEGGYISDTEIDRLKRKMDEETFRQEIMGEFISRSGMVWYAFTEASYSTETYSSLRPTVLCWDFNVDPMTCIVNQELSPDVWCAVKEFNHRNSNTESTGYAVLEWIQKQGLPNNLRLTGDYAGNQRRSSASRTDWQILRDIFKGYKDDLRPVRNIKDRVQALNARFKSYTGVVSQYVSPDGCPELYLDLIKQEWKNNHRDLDDMGGKRGHKSDALSYHAYNYYPLDVKKQFEFNV